jgi:hypothetical protein
MAIMTSREERDEEERFARAWNRWLEHPLNKQPSEAARDILPLLKERRAMNRPLWMPIAAAAALALGGAVMWKSLHAPKTYPSAGMQEASQVGQGEVLMWLDEKTPLYMTFQTPEGSGGKR